MPFHQKFAKKHIYPSRRYKTYSKCFTTAKQDAQAALALAKQVKGMVNVEYKQHIKKQLNLNIGTAITPIPLSIILQGDTNEKRDGDKVRIKWITFNYTLEAHADATATTVRVMLVHDRATNQQNFSAISLLYDSTSQNNLISPLNIDNSGRFQVFYDKVHTFSHNRHTHKKVYKKLDIPLTFDGNAGSISDMTRSSLSLVMGSNETQYLPRITYISRIRYIDN